MTKTKILNSLAEQMSRQYRLHAHYANRGDENSASDAHSRAWAIYWCGLDILGDSHQEKLDAVRRSARENAERFERMANSL